MSKSERNPKFELPSSPLPRLKDGGDACALVAGRLNPSVAAEIAASRAHFPSRQGTAETRPTQRHPGVGVSLRCNNPTCSQAARIFLNLPERGCPSRIAREETGAGKSRGPLHFVAAAAGTAALRCDCGSAALRLSGLRDFLHYAGFQFSDFLRPSDFGFHHDA
jgi:hypothetical protein